MRGLAGRGDGVIIGVPADVVEIYRTMFYLHSLSAGRIVASGSEIMDSDLPKDARWAVLLPGVRYSGSLPVAQSGSLSIVRR
jgi:hypothetical protein